MKDVIDISNQRFGKLQVIGQSVKKYKNRETLWFCQCDCGRVAHIPGNYLRIGYRKSCGCIWKPYDEEFKAKLKGKIAVNSRTKDKCFEWTGDTDRAGYGIIHTHTKTRKRVHEIYWKIHEGKIPKGSKVVQTCGNPLCFKLEHLFLRNY